MSVIGSHKKLLFLEEKKNKEFDVKKVKEWINSHEKHLIGLLNEAEN